MSNNFTQEFFNHYEKNSTSNEIEKYHLLWRSVISQAVIDVMSSCKKTESLIGKDKAIAWLSNSNQDFIYTCALANYDPAYVQNKVKPTLIRYTKKQKNY